MKQTMLRADAFGLRDKFAQFGIQLEVLAKVQQGYTQDLVAADHPAVDAFTEYEFYFRAPNGETHQAALIEQQLQESPMTKFIAIVQEFGYNPHERLFNHPSINAMAKEKLTAIFGG